MYHNYAVSNAEEMDEEADYLFKNSIYRESDIAIMPDAHKGKAHASVGFTATYTDSIIPNTIGVDLNCRVSLFYIVGAKDGGLDLATFDEVVNERVPSGFSLREREYGFSKTFPYESLKCWEHIKGNEQRYRLSMGTLGGGNHYIELDKDRGGSLMLCVHTGSRNLGLQVAEYYQKLAVRRKEKRIAFYKSERDAITKELAAQHRVARIQEARRTYDIRISSEPEDDLAYLEGPDMDDYLHDVDVVRAWSLLNHAVIAEEIQDGLRERGVDVRINHGPSCVHNYIDTKHKIIRKGAISAYRGELGIIPLNMRDGVLIVEGKSNPDWNSSLPHGAGRILSRAQAKKVLSMDDYRKGMEGIYTTSIAESTLDEWAEAYKSADAIMEAIAPNAKIVEHLFPVYNYKAKD